MSGATCGAYDLVCKIHSKRDGHGHRAWRLESLHGVLGSRALVAQVIGAFADDPELLLAGSGDLYLDGPTYVLGVGQLMQAFQPILPERYGFFAGTMFWLRPAPFADFAAAYPESAFVAHQDDDFHPEHAIERLFGVRAAALGGKVALTGGRGSRASLRIVPAASNALTDFQSRYVSVFPARYPVPPAAAARAFAGRIYRGLRRRAARVRDIIFPPQPK
jgi:hypothetical protein